MTRPMRHEYLRSFIRIGIYMTVQTALMAVLVSLILGISGETFGKVFLAMSLNVLSIPLAVATDVLPLPLWSWYIIVLNWVLSLNTYLAVTTKEDVENGRSDHLSDVDDELLP